MRGALPSAPLTIIKKYPRNGKASQMCPAVQLTSHLSTFRVNKCEPIFFRRAVEKFNHNYKLACNFTILLQKYEKELK